MPARTPTAASGVARLRFSVKPELPVNFEEVTWGKLRECVVAVHNKTPVSCSLEELYMVRTGWWGDGRQAGPLHGAIEGFGRVHCYLAAQLSKWAIGKAPGTAC